MRNLISYIRDFAFNPLINQELYINNHACSIFDGNEYFIASRACTLNISSERINYHNFYIDLCVYTLYRNDWSLSSGWRHAGGRINLHI